MRAASKKFANLMLFSMLSTRGVKGGFLRVSGQSMISEPNNPAKAWVVFDKRLISEDNFPAR